MVELSYAKRLQDLSSDYFNQLITRDEYVLQRKEILDAVDNEYNSVRKAENGTDEPSDSIFMNTISFFRSNTNEGEKEK